MILGIMQPYFFPYLGYFDVINRADKWIVFDGVKYSHKSWVNRNRILHPKEGWQYISVPVHKSSENARICDVVPVDMRLAEQRILGQLEHYRKRRAPFFREVVDLVKKTFATPNLNSISDLNVAGLKWVCDCIGIKFDYSIFTQLKLELPTINHPGQWALEIADALKADCYVNPPGGKEIFLAHEWTERGIRLEFTDLVKFHYATGDFNPIEHLSILDVLMWNEPVVIKRYLDSINKSI